ncbi:MAG TPA: tetratricopeptide repeat protein [Candidatus Intestinimonas pullistercoris]|uniref:Tetratricopeptide repeat protein n=1 Tax=Candidatus Intestinimonas pullistercoris TaxID=2838623 RepID=A0A9D2SZE5_9FIRM|nr:tetratricopeptide repeat protein [uncultured Intestinimonas sp.]HJC40752.1 tetratricopeptide repeat protein [Candidatus Intestinimonas pullistercoris]
MEPIERKQRTHALPALLLALVLTLAACGGQGARAWREQYDLGVRYLSEGNYEEAILAFTSAIEIDPNREEAYLDLAELYLVMGDLEQALSTLGEGYEATGSEAILELMESLEGQLPQTDINRLLDEYLTQEMVPAEAWTVNSVPFWEASQEDVAAAYPDSETGWDNSENVIDPVYITETVMFHWSKERNALWNATFSNRLHRAPDAVIQEELGLTTASTFEEVLTALGMSPEGIVYIHRVLPSLKVGDSLFTSETEGEAGTGNVIVYPQLSNDEVNPDRLTIAFDYRLDAGFWMGVTFLFDMDGNFDSCVFLVNPIS